MGKISVVGEKIRSRILDVITKADLNITVDFDNAFYNEFKQRVVNVTCNHDGSVSKRKLDGLYNGVFTCTVCDYKRYQDKALANGFKLLGKRHNGSNTLVKLQCPVCDEVFERASTTFFGNERYHCFNCVKIKYTKLLLLKDCVYLNHGIKNGKSMVTYINSQDEIREVASSSLTSDQWVASRTDSWWGDIRKTFVYKFTFKINDNYLGLENGEYFKIGSSNYPERRLTDLDLNLPVCIEILACAMNSKDIRITEKTIRDYYIEYKLPKEIPQIFTKGLSKRKLPDGTVKYAIDGATEWLFVPL